MQLFVGTMATQNEKYGNEHDNCMIIVIFVIT